jgi:predicted TIM-barrel fold metal-dependent hydrolase
MDIAGAKRFAVIGLQIAQIDMCVPNDYIAEQVDRSEGRAIGVASVDPTQPGAADEVDRAVRDLGLVGVKLSPPYQGFHPHCDEVWAIYERAAALGVFLMFHQSSVFVPDGAHEYANPVLLDKVARTFRDTPILIAHMGKPWCEEVVDLMVKNANVYTDVSAMSGKTLTLYNALRCAIEAGVTDRVLFGTDFPVFDPVVCLERMLALPTVNFPLPIPPDVIDGILYDRPLELLVARRDPPRVGGVGSASQVGSA